MFPHMVTHSVVLLLIASTTSQYMPPPPFSYPYPQGHPMPMMQMPGGAMPMSNGGPMMQMPGQPLMMPHIPRLPGMPSGPMPPPMSFPMHGGRLPMVVVPHHSKKADKHRKKAYKPKPKRKRINMESSSSEGSCSESEGDSRSRNKLRTSKKRRQVLTPVVSYVTKDGYVVYQKKIKKDKAKDWLEMTKGHDSEELKENIRYKKRDQ